MHGIGIRGIGRKRAVGSRFNPPTFDLLNGLMFAYDFNEVAGNFQDLNGGAYPLARNVVEHINGVYGKGVNGTKSPFAATDQFVSGGTNAIFAHTHAQSYTFATVVGYRNYLHGGSTLAFWKGWGNQWDYELSCDGDEIKFGIGDGITETGPFTPHIDGWYGWTKLIVCYYDAINHKIGISGEGSNFVETDVTGITPPLHAGSKFNIFTKWDTNAFNAAITMHFIARWSRLLSQAEVNYLYNGGKYRPYPFTLEMADDSYKLIFDGDSFVVRKTFALRTLKLCGRGHPLTDNLGVSGDTMVQVLLRTAITDAAYNPYCGQNILILSAGTNDVKAGRAAAAIYADITTYVTGRQAAGFKVICSTVIKRGDFDAGMEIVRLALNVLILANAAGADAVMDPGGDATFANPADDIYYSHDQIHLASIGEIYLADLAFAAIGAL